MLVNLNQVFQTHRSYAVLGFNVFGFEDAAPVIQAAEDVGEPVVLMVNRDACKHMPLDIFAPMLVTLAKKSKTQVVVHLDHAVDLNMIEKAISLGFSAVMFDGSQLDLQENISNSRLTIQMARPHGVSIEAEIGSVAYSDSLASKKSVYTDPETAKIFYEATKVDCLAVSVGSLHRMTTQTANIQYDRLKDIHQNIPIPLVIHGSTGVSDQDMQKLSAYGVGKINIGTCLRMAFGNALKNAIQDDPSQFDRIKLFQHPMQMVYQAAKNKFLLLRQSANMSHL